MVFAARFLRPVAASVLKPPGSRSFALVSKKPSAERTFAECYLNDPATYPIIIIISGALVMAGAVGLRCLFTNPDVRIGKTKRSQLIRDWS